MTVRTPQAATVIFFFGSKHTWLQSLAASRIVQEADSGCAVDGVHLAHDLAQLQHRRHSTDTQSAWNWEMTNGTCVPKREDRQTAVHVVLYPQIRHRSLCLEGRRAAVSVLCSWSGQYQISGTLQTFWCRIGSRSAPLLPDHSGIQQRGWWERFSVRKRRCYIWWKTYQFLGGLLGDVGVVCPWCQRVIVHTRRGFFIKRLQELCGLGLHLWLGGNGGGGRQQRYKHSDHRRHLQLPLNAQTDCCTRTLYSVIQFQQSSPLPWPLDSRAIIWGCSLVFIYRLDLLLLYRTSLCCII